MHKIPHQTLTFSLATADEFYEIKHFLKRNKIDSANRDDFIYIVRLNNTIIATARLLKIENSQNALWLRGLFVANEYRHLKIASQLLNHIKINLQEKPSYNTLYAFCECHLKPFYLSNQYQLILPSYLPKALQKRILRAQQNGKNWLCFTQQVQQT